MCFLYSTFAFLAGKEIPDNHWIAAALFTGLATLTRSIGVTLILAFSLFLIIKRPKKILLLMIISCAPFLYWCIFRSIVASEHIYWNIIIDQISDKSVALLFEQISLQIVTMFESWYWLFTVLERDAIPEFIVVIVSVLLFIFLLIGFSVRIKQNRFDALFVIFYLAVILVWPFTGIQFVSRFLYPLLPLIIFYIWTGIEKSFMLPVKRHLAFNVYLLLICIIAFPASSQFISRSYMNIDSELMSYRRNRIWLLAKTKDQALREIVYAREFIHILKNLADVIPPQECIYSFQTPIVMLYTYRISLALPSLPTNDEIFQQNIKGCRYLLVSNFVDGEGVYVPFYPLERVNPVEYNITIFPPAWPDYDDPVALLLERIE